MSMHLAVLAFDVIGVVTTAAVVVVTLILLVDEWRDGDSWVFYLPALDPRFGEVDVEVRIPSLIPAWVARRLLPRAYRRACLDVHCDPIDLSTSDRKATK